MPILKFLWLAIRPISKLESVVGWWDVLNLALLIAYPTIGQLAVVDLFEGASLVWFAGIPALLLLIAGIKLQFRLSGFEKTRPKIDICPIKTAMNINLQVQNKSDVTANFSATMTCSLDNGKELVEVGGLKSVAMWWESSSKASVDIHGGGRDILKLCSSREIYKNNVVHFYCIDFYKVEADSPKTIPANHWAMDTGTLPPKVKVDIQVSSDKLIRGRRDWQFQICYDSDNMPLIDICDIT